MRVTRRTWRVPHDHPRRRPGRQHAAPARRPGQRDRAVVRVQALGVRRRRRGWLLRAAPPQPPAQPTAAGAGSACPGHVREHRRAGRIERPHRAAQAPARARGQVPCGHHYPVIRGELSGKGRLCRAAGRRDVRLPLAVLTCAARVLTVLRPGLAASLVIVSLSAASGACQIAASPPSSSECRTSGGLRSSGSPAWRDRRPGRGLPGRRAAAGVVTPAVVIGAGAGGGAVAALVLTFRWPQVSPPGGPHAAGRRPGHAGVNGRPPGGSAARARRPATRAPGKIQKSDSPALYAYYAC